MTTPRGCTSRRRVSARKLAEQGFAGAQRLPSGSSACAHAWPRVVLRLLSDTPPDMVCGGRLQLRVAAALDGLKPEDVRVEFVARRRLPASNFEPPPLSSYNQAARDGQWSAMLAPTGEVDAEGGAVFALDAESVECGQFATRDPHLPLA